MLMRGEKPQELLNHLLVACIDDQFSMLAAVAVLPIDQTQRLRDVVGRRRAFGRELVTHIDELGGAAARHGSMRPHVRALFQRVNRALVGGTQGDAYRGLATSEARTEALYAKVLGRALPPDARVTIERQYQEIARDRSDFRRQQWAASGHALAAPEPTAPRALPTQATPPARGAGHLAQWADDGGRQPGWKEDE